MPQKITVYWRDIPSQIIIKQGRSKGKWVLSQRFQEAIDKAAMRAGMEDTDSYVEQWRRETEACELDGSIQETAEQVAAQVEAEWDDVWLGSVVRNKGLVIEA